MRARACVCVCIMTASSPSMTLVAKWAALAVPPAWRSALAACGPWREPPSRPVCSPQVAAPRPAHSRAGVCAFSAQGQAAALSSAQARATVPPCTSQATRPVTPLPLPACEERATGGWAAITSIAAPWVGQRPRALQSQASRSGAASSGVKSVASHARGCRPDCPACSAWMRRTQWPCSTSAAAATAATTTTTTTLATIAQS